MSYFYYLGFNTQGSIGYTLDVKWDTIYNIKSLKDWITPSFYLNEGNFTDLQANNHCWVLCSQKLKKIIDDTCKYQLGDYIWYPANVISKTGVIRQFFILVIKENPNLIIKENSLIIKLGNQFKDSTLVPVLKYEKVKNLDIFLLSKYDIRPIISEKLKRSIQDQKCTGIEFNRVFVR